MTYQVRGFQSCNTENGCDAVAEVDTMKDAREKARYWLTDEYRKRCEASARLAVVQITKNGELVDEFTNVLPA